MQVFPSRSSKCQLTRKALQDLHLQHLGLPRSPPLNNAFIKLIMSHSFYPPGVGMFQDAGPLQNDPLISALSEVAAMFPLVEEPDSMVSRGTGAPCTTSGKPSMSVSGPLSLWKDGAFPRLWRMF